MRTDKIEIERVSGLRLLELRASCTEAFAYQLNSCLADQDSDTAQHFLSRQDVAHAFAVSAHALAVWHAALHDDLRRRHGTPKDARAAARLPIAPWQQTLLLGERPKIPNDPNRDPHGVPDMPAISYDWSQPLTRFLLERRRLASSLRDQPDHRQTTFAEMSQPPEREPGDDPDEPDELAT